MYYCNCCGETFYHPTNRYNRVVDRWDEDAGCPFCGSEDFEEREEEDDDAE